MNTLHKRQKMRALNVAIKEAVEQGWNAGAQFADARTPFRAALWGREGDSIRWLQIAVVSRWRAKPQPSHVARGMHYEWTYSHSRTRAAVLRDLQNWKGWDWDEVRLVSVESY
jgi:hypothetical protein